MPRTFVTCCAPLQEKVRTLFADRLPPPRPLALTLAFTVCEVQPPLAPGIPHRSMGALHVQLHTRWCGSPRGGSWLKVPLLEQYESFKPRASSLLVRVA